MASYWIQASKKGSLPIGFETRKKGKKVTVISNVHGDGDALLAALKVASYN
jgi:translation initiation factor 1 (eIF-1/SUI1)